MKAPGWGRRLIASTMGVYPAHELRDRLCRAAAVRRNRRYQRDEIRRLREQRGGRPRSRVLVVIPTYGRPEQLTRAVASALSQTYADLTVVVVNDGGSLPELPRDPRLSAVSLRRNCATLGLVRNVGIALADSEFIAFLDDDNAWTPDHVATAVDALQRDATLAAVYTSVRRLRPDGSELDVLRVPFDRGALRNANYIDANSLVVRRSRDPGFSLLPRDKSTLQKEDWEYVWRLSGRGRLAHVPKVTVLYSVNPDSYYSDWSDEQIGCVR